MANRKRTMLGLVVVGALALPGSALTRPALADNAIRSFDASGSIVIQMPDNGAKIIRIGAAQKTASRSAQRIKVISGPQDRAVAHIVAKPNSDCESAVVRQGRSFMYGIDRGETPVLDHAGCSYQ
ncbi:hypothetical protein [Brucella sp. LJL56]